MSSQFVTHSDVEGAPASSSYMTLKLRGLSETACGFACMLVLDLVSPYSHSILLFVLNPPSLFNRAEDPYYMTVGLVDSGPIQCL